MASSKRLYKSSDPMIVGVCGGIAEYFKIDPTLTRILALVITIAGLGIPIIFYLIGIAFIPTNPAVRQGYIYAKATEAAAASPAGSVRSTEKHVSAGSGVGSMVSTTVSNMGRVTSDYWSFVVVIGALLVCVGSIILLGNLVNVSFWRFWPLILVITGIIQLFTPSLKGWSIERAGGAIVLVTIGLVLLAWTLQVISTRAFILCFNSLWPVLLIVAGLYIISGAKKLSVVSLVSSLLLSATFLMGFWYYGITDGNVSVRFPNGNELEFSLPASPLSQARASDGATELWRLDLGTASEANLQLYGGGASTAIVAGEGTAILVHNLTSTSSSGGELGFSDVKRNSVYVDLSQFTSGHELRTTLPNSLVWNELRAEARSTDLNLNLAGLKVRSIDIRAGMSSCILRLDAPLQGGSRVDVHGGIASVRIEVPRDSAVILYVSRISTLDIDLRDFTYNPTLGAWCSKSYAGLFEDWQTADGGVWIIHQSGVAAFEIRMY